MRRVGSCSPRFRSTCYHCDENVVDDNSWQLCSVPFAFVRFEFIGIRVFAFVPSMTVRCPPKKMSDYSSRPCRTTFIQLPRRRMDLLQFDFNLIPLTTRPSFLSCLNLTTGLRNSECRLFFFRISFVTALVFESFIFSYEHRVGRSPRSNYLFGFLNCLLQQMLVSAAENRNCLSL